MVEYHNAGVRVATSENTQTRIEDKPKIVSEELSEEPEK